MNIAILGSGPGGYVAALKAAQMGAKVTIIEEKEVGGVCLNEGCIPTKTLLASAEVYAKARNLEMFGIELSGTVGPNMKKIIERKNSVISTQVKGIRSLLKTWGIVFKEGRGRFVSDAEIRVVSRDGGEETVTADKFLVATGSRPASIPMFPFDGKNIINSTDALNLTEIPKSMIIIGAGVMGCEFACMYHEFGTDITLVELMDRPLTTEDPEIAQIIEREFKKKKVKLFTGVKTEKVTVEADGVHVFLSNGKEITAEKLLVSIGRAFNSNDIGAEAAGIEKGARGEITVNAYLQTSNPNVFAAGDVIGGLLLAHVASQEGITAVKNIMGHREAIDLSIVPSGIFTHPEIGSVGFRENQLEQRGVKYKVGRFQYRALGKAHAMGDIAGMFKVIAEAETHKILGVHIVGHSAADIVHEAAVLMKAGLTVRDLAETIHAHPTLTEGLVEAAEDVFGEAIHSAPKKEHPLAK
jgi:dihydrolipoamide dehydrogenase